jgi:hypothetical protein
LRLHVLCWESGMISSLLLLSATSRREICRWSSVIHGVQEDSPPEGEELNVVQEFEPCK